MFVGLQAQELALESFDLALEPRRVLRLAPLLQLVHLGLQLELLLGDELGCPLAVRVLLLFLLLADEVDVGNLRR